MNTKKIIAILMASFQKWGCPVCGYTLGDNQDAGPGYQDFICGQCNQKLSLLGLNLLCTPYMVGDPPEYIYIEGRHPREGIPSHDVQIKPKEFEVIISNFEKEMSHNHFEGIITPQIMTNLTESTAFKKLNDGFPVVISELGEYLEEKYIAKGYGQEIGFEWCMMFDFISSNKKLENVPKFLNSTLNDWKNWALNFKY